MIVRGAVLSDKRVSLESPGNERPPLAAVRTGASASSLRETASKAVETGALMPAAAPPAPAPPPLTLDAVSKWIEKQGQATRTALSQLLAEDLEELRQKARDQGAAEGRAAGLAIVTGEATKSLGALAAIVKRSDEALKEQREQLADQCAEIVAAALTRIAGPLLATREAVIGAVTEVLKRLTEETQLTIRVSADDLPALREVEDQLAAALAGREYSLVADTRVEAGGALVESPLGSLDGRLEVQLRGLADTVIAAKALRGKQP